MCNVRKLSSNSAITLNSTKQFNFFQLIVFGFSAHNLYILALFSSTLLPASAGSCLQGKTSNKPTQLQTAGIQS